MSRTKKIYFLSAFVLIIGCYALNLSYSLFTQTVTPENNTVDATVPYLSASLETSTFTIPANDSKVITLNIINSGTSDINYGISVSDTKGTTIQLVETSNITGKLAASTTEGETTSKEVLVYVTNPTDTEITDLTFDLTSNYTTIAFDDDSFIDSSNIDCENTVKLLKESILTRAKDTSITDVEKTVYDDTFNLNNITTASSESDRMLALAEDDYGTSYVFRGNVLDNYVSFAGFTWRIVRINGDGSIRLILDGTLDSVYRQNNDGTFSETKAGTKSQFNTQYSHNVYIGYMYGGGLDYNQMHDNLYDSTIKEKVDFFYKTYIENSDNKYHYEKYLSDSIFCGDKTLGSSGDGIGMNATIYASGDRFSFNEQSIYTPTLKCAEGSDVDYSRYTSNLDENTIINGISVNNDLSHPIALLSADELVMAGAIWPGGSSSYYLADAYYYDTKTITYGYWTMTPSSFNGSKAYVFQSTFDSDSLTANNVYNIEYGGVRPVINLKANVVVNKDDDGTQTNPYVIK